MDKKSKEALRRYKKARQTRSSSDSSSSDSDSSSSSSYSSSDSERKAMERHRRKKAKLAASGGVRRSSSSSATERRKREKREHCQKLLEAKRDHLKRKLKEAKLKKRAAAAAAALSGHSHRSLSPATQAKLKKLAERKHLRAVSKERREREKEKHRAAAREKEREHHRGASRSPKITKIRIHQDVKRQKSPPRIHHALMSREKIIIQTRTRERTPSAERERRRHEHHKSRHDDDLRERERRDRDRERAEREAARDKERAEALARCQERQRERERIAREKLRREEEEKKYGSTYATERERERLLARGAERELPMTTRGYSSRERSLEAVERSRHASKRDLEYERDREREYLEAERRGLLDRDELRRERDYLATHRRELSPIDHYNPRLRDHRDLYVEDECDRVYGRAYLTEGRHSRDAWIDPREMRERELLEMRDPRDLRDIEHDLLMYPEERERLLRERERRADWKSEWEAGREREWEEAVQSSRGGFVGGPKRPSLGGSSVGPTKGGAHEPASEPDWDMDETPEGAVPGSSAKKVDTPNLRETGSFASGSRDAWLDKEHHDRRWPADWREAEEGSPRLGTPGTPLLHHRSERGRGSYRRGPGERTPTSTSYRSHPPPSLMAMPVQTPGSYHGSTPTRFPSKRSMTYTNPNLIKKQQAALVAAKAAAQASAVAAATTAVAAAKAAAQSAASGSTNPGILGQVSGKPETPTTEEKPEAGEIIADTDGNTKTEAESTVTNSRVATVASVEDKGGELSEISDSDDDILSKGEKRAKTDTEEVVNEAEEKLVGSTMGVCESEKSAATPRKEDLLPLACEEKPVEEDEMLDFEEISDGELEEDARHKVGVSDALGVDWASLIEETKRQAETTTCTSNEHFTTAKQKWQPHRIFLDVGISMRMAGEEHGKKLLADAQQKLNEELSQFNEIKKEIKDEVGSQMDEDSHQMMLDTDDNTNDVDEKKSDGQLATPKPLDELQASSALNLDNLHPVACMQVAMRRQQLEKQKLFTNACGINSRALSARHDLRLRRQLCGLPADDHNLPTTLPPVSAKLKSMAMNAFLRNFEMKPICTGVSRWVN